MEQIPSWESTKEITSSMEQKISFLSLQEPDIGLCTAVMYQLYSVLSYICNFNFNIFSPPNPKSSKGFFP
jgi:hypothetical protein